MNIYQRINEVKKKVAYVQKAKAVENYKAVTHDQVTALTRQHFIDNGVVVAPCELSSVVVDSGGRSSKGTIAIRFEAKWRVDFINMDEPSDKASIEVTSHALDYGDKAPGKAASYATKTAILKMLQLETGEDDESRYQTNEEEAPQASEALLKAAKGCAEKGVEKYKEFWQSITEQERHAIGVQRHTDFKTIASEVKV